MEKMDGVIPLSQVSSTQAMISALGTGFTVKGVVTSNTDLPESGDLSDLYLVSDEGYASYVWDGDSWELKDGDIASNNDIDSALYS